MMAETDAFHLELENPKRNVFVTQLADDDAASDSTRAGGVSGAATGNASAAASAAPPKRGSSLETGVRQLPVIKESASKILESSPNTLQKTLLIKREVEVRGEERGDLLKQVTRGHNIVVDRWAESS